MTFSDSVGRIEEKMRLKGIAANRDSRSAASCRRERRSEGMNESGCGGFPKPHIAL
jgi:hypothetical protein